MTGWTLKRWVAVCALGALMGAAGCDGGLIGRFRGGSPPCPYGQKPAGPRVVARLNPNRGRECAPCPTTVAGCAGLAGCAPCVTPAGKVAARIVSAGAGAAPAPAAPSSPPGSSPHGEPEYYLAPAMKPAPMPANLPEPGSGIEQMSMKTITHEAAPSRRGYADLTVQAWFGCAEDHSWLKGQILYSRSTSTWRLHYASVDDTDPYGGTVTLTGGERLKPLKDGMAVRIKGRLLDPDRRQPESPYEVSSFEILDKE